MPETTNVGAFTIQRLMEAMGRLSASDLHIKVGSPPFYRVDGELRPADLPPLGSRDTESIAADLLPMRKSDGFAA